MLSTGFKGLPVILVCSVLLVTDLVKGNCDGVPEVPNSSNNATSVGPFPNNYFIGYTCKIGYRGYGNRSIFCNGNDWVGQYECLKTCGSVEPPKNGHVVGKPTYVVSSNITFACNIGYRVDGTAVLRCRNDRNWRPSSPPVCKPVDCGPFDSVENGNSMQENLDGVLNDYGSEIYVTCNDGYIIGGTPTVTCEADGQWSAAPSCTFSSCGQHPGLNSKCIEDVEVLDSMVTVLCYEPSANRSITEKGEGTDYCQNNQWEQIDMGCFCDCMVNTQLQGVIYNDLHAIKFVKHGMKLNWDCQSGYKKDNSSTNISCNDGEMEQPRCIKITTNGTSELDKLVNSFKWYHGLGIGIVCVIVVAVIVFVLVKFNVINCKKNDSDKAKGEIKQNKSEELPLNDQDP